MTGPSSFIGRLGRFVSYNVASQVWLALVSLVATPILYDGLGAAAYGLLAVVNLVAAQLSVLELGFGHATVRRLSGQLATDDVPGMSRTLATSSSVFLVMAIVGALIVLVSADLLAERYFRFPPELVETGKVALRIAAAFVVVTLVSNLGSAAWQGLQRFAFLNVLAAVAATAQIVGSVVLVVLGYAVLDVLAWSVLVGFVSAAAYFAWLPRSVPGLKPFGALDRGAFREMLGFGLLLMAAGVLTQVFYSGGPLVLGHYVSVAALPFFTVPFGLYQRLNRMGYGLSAALYPLIAELDGLRDQASLDRVFVSGTRMLVAAGVAAMAPAVLLASPFLSAWLGPQFAREGGLVLELLFATFAVSLASTPSVELARGRGRGAWLVGYTAVLAVANLVGIALLASSHGVVGAAWAFLIAQLLGTGFLLVRVGGRSVAALPSTRMVAYLLLASALTAAALVLVEAPLGRLAVAAWLGLLLAWIGSRWALTPDERTVIRRLIART